MIVAGLTLAQVLLAVPLDYFCASLKASSYPETKLALLVKRGESEAEPVVHPTTGELLKPERHLFLRPGDGLATCDLAVAHDSHDGVIFQREVLRAVYVQSVQRFKLTFELERFDRNGRLLPETKEQRQEKGKCRSCHAINVTNGQLLSTDPGTGRPDPNLPLKIVYERALERRRLPETNRRLPFPHLQGLNH
jgi:hypothetical protein